MAKIEHLINCENGVTGLGTPDAAVMGIGIAPGRDEWNFSRQPFTGQAGRMLRSFLRALGWDAPNKGPIENWFLTNGLCWWKDAPEPSDLAECWPRLSDEIRRVKPKLIVVFGQLMRDFLLPDQKRGYVQWSNQFNCWTMYTVHPAAIVRDSADANQVADFWRDLSKIHAILEWPPGPRGAVQFDLIDRTAAAQQVLDSFAPEELVALDIEARYIIGNEILCIGLAGEHGIYVFHKDALPGLKWPKHVRWAMQNGTVFDVAKIKEQLGVELWVSEDTLLQSYSLDERGGKDNEVTGSGEQAVGIHGLKDNACEYLGVEPWDLRKQGGIERVWDSGPDGERTVAAYNAQDAAYTRELVLLFKQRQITDDVRNVYTDIMIPAANALREIREWGGHISEDGTGELVREWVPRWMALEEQLKDESNIDNLNSTPQLAHYIYDVLGLPIEQVSKNRIKREQTKTKKTTNRYALEYYMNKYEVPFLRRLIEWRQLDHLINTYIYGIQDDIEHDGRVHPRPIMQGTRTGRLAYHKPPIQTIPKHGEDLVKVRKMFDAPPGFELIEADYRQAELWVAYFLSGDEALLASLETGDFHAATTERVFEVPRSHPDFAEHRYESKRITFGIFYGRGEKSLAEAFGKTEAYWRLAINKWASEYHVYWAYKEREKQKVRINGEQQSLSGRKRRYYLVQEKALNSAINMPIQTMSHEHLLVSLTRLQLEKHLEPLGAHLLWEIHDSLLIESPIARRIEVIRKVKSVMEQPMFGFPRGLTVDVKVGPTWFDMEDFND